MRVRSGAKVLAWSVQALGAAAVLAVSACGPAPGTGSGQASSPAAGTPAQSSPPATASTPVTPGGPEPPRPGAWRLLPASPVPARAQLLVTVWTGREMLIHGIVSTGKFNVAARGVTYAYRPASNTWATLAPGPAPQMAQNHETAIWTGSEMIVFGLTSAAYSPATNTWRPVPRPPAGVVGAVRLWTGHQVIFWGGGCCGGVKDSGAAYSPATNSWRRLPPSPLSARTGITGAWTGHEVIIAGGFRPPGDAAHPYRTFASAAAYNPATGTWRRLPPMPEPRSGAMVVYDGRDVLYIGGRRAEAGAPSAGGVAYRPATNSWRRLPAMEFARWDAVAVWTGRDVLIWGGTTGTFLSPAIPPHGVSYRPAAGRWSALPMAPLRGRAGPVGVWTGRSLIVWGGSVTAGLTTKWLTDGAAYTPGPG